MKEEFKITEKEVEEIANEKDTMAIKRYRAIQREAKAILIPNWTGTEKH